MLIFYLIFDCICNGFAELTCFADREFYKGNGASIVIDLVRLVELNYDGRVCKDVEYTCT